MLIIWIIVYIIVSTCLIIPFRISSAESRREEEELREAKR